MDSSSLFLHTNLIIVTLAGARALGMETRIGSLLAGKLADVIAIDLSALETQPVYDPISQIIYAAGREQVSHVWIDGRCLMKDRELISLNLNELEEKASWWRSKIARS